MPGGMDALLGRLAEIEESIEAVRAGLSEGWFEPGTEDHALATEELARLEAENRKLYSQL